MSYEQGSFEKETPREPAKYSDTSDAKELMRALEAVGLELSIDAKHKFDHEGSTRFGNAYAWMTRSVAAWMNNERQTLFKETDTLPADIDQLELPESVGARLLVDLVKQTNRAQREGITESNIPVPSEAHDVKKSSCKDVEAYFAQAVAGHVGPDKLRTITLGDNKRFWHKTHGDPTFINLDEVLYNGVQLPPGCVFRHEGEGLLFLRVTGLAFEQSEAEQILGVSVTEWYEAKDGKQQMDNLFRRFQEERDKGYPQNQSDGHLRARQFGGSAARATVSHVNNL